MEGEASAGVEGEARAGVEGEERAGVEGEERAGVNDVERPLSPNNIPHTHRVTFHWTIWLREASSSRPTARP